MYRELIAEWRDVLPTQSVVLSLPIFPPALQDDPTVRALEAGTRAYRDLEPPAESA